MPSVDEKLLAQGDDSADRAGDLRESKKNSQRGDYADQMGGQEGGSSYSNLRLAKQKDKIQKSIKNRKAKKGVKSPVSPLFTSLAALLRQAWILLIKSFGLTMIWINIHILGNAVFGPKIFCNLGEEWFIRPGTANNPAMKKKIKEAGKRVGLIEKIGVSCCNLSCLLILIISLAPLIIMLEMLSDPFGFLVAIGRAVLGWVWSGVKLIVGGS